MRFDPRLVAVLAAALVSACADRNPLAGGAAPAPAEPVAVARLACTVRVAARSLTCAEPAASRASRADLVMGSPHVKLASSNVGYDGTLHFSADVTVTNQIPQPMGTADGTTPSPEGTRVFFATGPQVTAGDGVVTVSNADGTGAFTAAGQPFFRYAGILQPGETSSARTWAFDVPPTVSTFSFTVYVDAPLPNETGWIDLSPVSREMIVGGAQHVAATVRRATGTAAAGQPVTWATSDSTVVKVDASGMVTGVGLGSAVVTATSGSRTGSVPLTMSVTDSIAPALTDLGLSRTSAAPGDTVTFAVGAADAGTGIGAVSAVLRAPSGVHSLTCDGRASAGATRAEGTFTCSVVIGAYDEQGTWTLERVGLADLGHNFVQVWSDEMAARGFATTVQVINPAADVTAPTLTGLDMGPDTVDVTDSVTFTFSVADGASGVANVSAVLRSPSGVNTSCEATAPLSGTRASGTFSCRAGFSVGAEQGTWTLWDVMTVDVAGNSATEYTDTLALQGFPRQVTVVGGQPDSIAPALTGFSFTPSTVSAHDTVQVTITATDGGTGIANAGVTFESPSGSHEVDCVGFTPASGTRAAGTFRCRFGFPPAPETGTWKVKVLAVSDRTGNTIRLSAPDLQGLGYASALTVTP